MNNTLVRDVTEDDCAAIQAIYADHVRDGLASWEETPPDVAEINRRMAEIKKGGFPYRVIELDGVVRGYAYAGSYRPRPAYRFTVENSVYVDSASTGKGLGGRLLEDLIEQCTSLGFRQMIAVIGDSANTASIKLHARYGFAHSGVMGALGFKHGRWLDQVLMQLPLGEGDKTPPQ
ncbi:MAG: N-acetyltransferase [Rhodospirillaceae bacterium]|jgi:L-amino acid N-acyltransferase YncA|nr:N-acetyltransferase [Rhodospirillaceae bacterium]MBT5243450.1 N-acetyltransferase [Rhodospirillaceae bacterium]MBT5562038.1 N-acetyltransferase [Rhodospirillaceae bacterium]MBT6242211.1 N-acetyltransferase [Rhodospirillaceae bacterium]MBT7136243.1 N-acetyltransferase [Rhodospirillaceae bacterium]